MDTSSSVSLLKVDRSGRVRVPAEKKRQILEEFDRSGMSGAAFAALVGVKYQTFASWRRRRSQAPSNRRQRSTPIRFVEAQAPRPSVGMELECPATCVRGSASGPTATGGGRAASSSRMLRFSGAPREFVAIAPGDMRIGFSALHALITERLGHGTKSVLILGAARKIVYPGRAIGS